MPQVDEIVRFHILYNLNYTVVDYLDAKKSSGGKTGHYAFVSVVNEHHWIDIFVTQYQFRDMV